MTSLKFEKFGIGFSKQIEAQTLIASQYWNKDRSQESMTLAFKGIFGQAKISVGLNVDHLNEETKAIENYLKLQYQLSSDTFQSVQLKQKNYENFNTVLTHTHYFNDNLTFGFQAQMNFDYNSEKFVNGRLLIQDNEDYFKMGFDYSATTLEFAQYFFKFQLKHFGMKINYDPRKNTKEVKAVWKQNSQTFQAGMQFNTPKSYDHVLGFMWSYEF